MLPVFHPEKLDKLPVKIGLAFRKVEKNRKSSNGVFFISGISAITLERIDIVAILGWEQDLSSWEQDPTFSILPKIAAKNL